MTDRLMTIGAFAERSGLSIAALRYYDRVGLLEPAAVDEDSGYRRYGAQQLTEGGRIRILRALDLPMAEVRSGARSRDGLGAAIEAQRDRLVHRARALGELAMAVARDDPSAVRAQLAAAAEGESTMTDTAARPVQITIRVDDAEETARFYREAFGAVWDDSISSFVFGTWKTDSFFLLTLEREGDGGYPGSATCFGLLVDDVDAAHARAIEAGGREVQAPADFEWKPRTSIVEDPSGNRIALSLD